MNSHLTAGRVKALCCEVAVLAPNALPMFCGNPCDHIDPGLCINGGVPDDIASGPDDLAKRDVVPGSEFHELEKRRNVKLDPTVFDFLTLAITALAITLRTAFSSGTYFDNRRGGAPVQGFYIQSAPLNATANGATGIQGCRDGGITLVRMSQQSQLRAFSAYEPETEHPIDVSDARRIVSGCCTNLGQIDVAPRD
jgi:hypothetical protein